MYRQSATTITTPVVQENPVPENIRNLTAFYNEMDQREEEVNFGFETERGITEMRQQQQQQQQENWNEDSIEWHSCVTRRDFDIAQDFSGTPSTTLTGGTGRIPTLARGNATPRDFNPYNPQHVRLRLQNINQNTREDRGILDGLDELARSHDTVRGRMGMLLDLFNFFQEWWNLNPFKFIGVIAAAGGVAFGLYNMYRRLGGGGGVAPKTLREHLSKGFWEWVKNKTK